MIFCAPFTSYRKGGNFAACSPAIIFWANHVVMLMTRSGVGFTLMPGVLALRLVATKAFAWPSAVS